MERKDHLVLLDPQDHQEVLQAHQGPPAYQDQPGDLQARSVPREKSVVQVPPESEQQDILDLLVHKDSQEQVVIPDVLEYQELLEIEALQGFVDQQASWVERDLLECKEVQERRECRGMVVLALRLDNQVHQGLQELQGQLE